MDAKLKENRIKLTLGGLGAVEIFGTGEFVPRIFGAVIAELAPEIREAVASGVPARVTCSDTATPEIREKLEAIEALLRNGGGS